MKKDKKNGIINRKNRNIIKIKKHAELNRQYKYEQYKFVIDKKVRHTRRKMNLFKQEDTIVALATGNIKAALAIIRISGKLSKEVVSSIFKTKNFKSIELEDKKVLHGVLIHIQVKIL